MHAKLIHLTILATCVLLLLWGLSSNSGHSGPERKGWNAMIIVAFFIFLIMFIANL
jgi:hypothetical protein